MVWIAFYQYGIYFTLALLKSGKHRLWIGFLTKKPKKANSGLIKGNWQESRSPFSTIPKLRMAACRLIR